MARKVYVGVEPEIKQLSEMSVGSSVKLNVGGSPTEFLVVHQGLPSSTYDSSCNGIWLVMKDCYETMQWNTSTNNSYKTSSVHTYLNGTFLNKLDADVKSIVKQVKIPYWNGEGQSGSIASGSSGLSTKVFLLSAKEVGTSGDYSTEEGANLSYFTSNSRRIAKLNGSAIYWWLRSVCTYNNSSHRYDACCIYTDGTLNVHDAVTNTYAAIRPALILPLETTVIDGIVTTTSDTTSVAHNVTNMYVGIENKARYIKKGYVGINNVARPFWGEYTLQRYGTTTNLSQARSHLAAATINNEKAIFIGGSGAGSRVNTIDVYDSSLTRTSSSTLGTARSGHKGGSIGQYAVFAGGYSTGYCMTVEAINSSMTLTTISSLTKGGNGLAATSSDKYVAFSGCRWDTDGNDQSDQICLYNASLTKTTKNMRYIREYHGCAAVGDYILFAGGYGNRAWINGVDALNSSLTISAATTLTEAKYELQGVSNGEYALFCGGSTQYADHTTSVDAYNASLTKSTPTACHGYTDASSVRLGNYALYAGGMIDYGTDAYSNIVDVYDHSLTKTQPTGLSSARYGMAATAIGNYALFGGGVNNQGSTKHATVDAYKLV